MTSRVFFYDLLLIIVEEMFLHLFNASKQGCGSELRLIVFRIRPSKIKRIQTLLKKYPWTWKKSFCTPNFIGWFFRGIWDPDTDPNSFQLTNRIRIRAFWVAGSWSVSATLLYYQGSTIWSTYLSIITFALRKCIMYRGAQQDYCMVLTGGPRRYRKYILQITQPSQYRYAK